MRSRIISANTWQQQEVRKYLPIIALKNGGSLIEFVGYGMFDREIDAFAEAFVPLTDIMVDFFAATVVVLGLVK